MTINIDLPAADLHNGVKNAIRFVSKEKSAAGLDELLTMAHLVVRDGVLVLEATDRYKMIQIRVSSDNRTTIDGQTQDKTEHTSITCLPATTLKDMEVALRDQAKVKTVITPMVKVVVEAKKITVSIPAGQEDHSYRVDYSESYPNLNRIIDTFSNDISTGSAAKAFNPDVLKAVSMVADARYSKNDQTLGIIASDGARKPLAIQWFSNNEVWARGLVMPLVAQPVTLGDLSQF